ncbi:unnamed protein product [Arabidopsis halleri]
MIHNLCESMHHISYIFSATHFLQSCHPLPLPHAWHYRPLISTRKSLSKPSSQAFHPDACSLK